MLLPPSFIQKLMNGVNTIVSRSPQQKHPSDFNHLILTIKSQTPPSDINNINWENLVPIAKALEYLLIVLDLNTSHVDPLLRSMCRTINETRSKELFVYHMHVLYHGSGVDYQLVEGLVEAHVDSLEKTNTFNTTTPIFHELLGLIRADSKTITNITNLYDKEYVKVVREFTRTVVKNNNLSLNPLLS